MSNYLVPEKFGEAEFFEKKSRFIGRCMPVSSEEEALSFLQSIRKQHRDATHNVYCYRIKATGLCRHSDDGEPSGTSGMPLLEVFLRREVFDFVCVATRYFGGILLGAGGLTRAYSHTGVIALEASGITAMRSWRSGSVSLPYSLYKTVSRWLSENGASSVESDFAEEVCLSFRLPEENWDLLSAFLQNSAGGRITPRDMGKILGR